MPPRGFCVTIGSLNGALAWLTIEDAGGTFETQPACGLPQGARDERETQWNPQLQKILKP
jgi:hypothetical protein